MEPLLILALILIAANGAATVALLMRRPAKPAAPAQQPSGLSKKSREALETAAQKKVEKLIERTSKDFEKDLGSVRARLNKETETLAKGVSQKELQGYAQALTELRQRTEARVTEIEQSAEKFRDERMKQVAEEVDAERNRLVERLDQRMSDVVSAYLAESLGEEADLGAQTDHLLKNLDEHKVDIRKDLLREY